MTAKPPLTDFYCPVCGSDLKFIILWQQPSSDRVRIFCDDCALLPEYRALPKEERTVLNETGFQRFAAARMLRHVYETERSKESQPNE